LYIGFLAVFKLRRLYILFIIRPNSDTQFSVHSIIIILLCCLGLTALSKVPGAAMYISAVVYIYFLILLVYGFVYFSSKNERRGSAWFCARTNEHQRHCRVGDQDIGVTGKECG
jgi:hypothetical protein